MLETLIKDAMQEWERLISERGIQTPRRADELAQEVTTDTLQKFRVAAPSDAEDSDEAEALRTVLYEHSALRFPGNW